MVSKTDKKTPSENDELLARIESLEAEVSKSRDDNAKLKEELAEARTSGSDEYRSMHMGERAMRTDLKSKKWPFRVTGKWKKGDLEPHTIEARAAVEAIRLYIVRHKVKNDAGQEVTLDPTHCNFQVQCLKEDERNVDIFLRYARKEIPVPQIPVKLTPTQKAMADTILEKEKQEAKAKAKAETETAAQIN